MIGLLPDWRRIILRAWSVRLMAAATILSGLEVGLPLAEGALPVPQGVFAALSGMATAGAFAARIYAQRAFKEKDKAE